MIYHQFSWLVTESLHIYICLYLVSVPAERNWCWPLLRSIDFGGPAELGALDGMYADGIFRDSKWH